MRSSLHSISITCVFVAAGLILVSCNSKRGTQPPAETLPSPTPHHSEADLPHFLPATTEQRELRRKAEIALGTGDKAGAIAALKALIDTEPLSTVQRDGYVLYADLLAQDGHAQQAVDLLNDVVPTLPPSGDVFLVLAREQKKLGQIEDAIRSLRDATRASPELLRAWIALAQLLEEQGKTDETDNVMIHYERQVYLIGRKIQQGATMEERLYAIAQLRIALPDPRISRILASALENDAFEVQSAALRALLYVGTPNAIDAVKAYQKRIRNEKLQTMAHDVLEAIEKRQ